MFKVKFPREWEEKIGTLVRAQTNVLWNIITKYIKFIVVIFWNLEKYNSRYIVNCERTWKTWVIFGFLNRDIIIKCSFLTRYKRTILKFIAFGSYPESNVTPFPVCLVELNSNKKVLLCERKRHTDRGVSSTTRGGVPPPSGYPPPARSNGGGTRGGAGLTGGTQGGVPPVRVPPLPQPGLTRGGGTPLRQGTSQPGPMGRYPRWGPPIGVPPGKGYPPGWDTPAPCLDLARVPPLGVDRQTDTCQNITFPSYYAVCN